jgi:hypothetical protein
MKVDGPLNRDFWIRNNFFGEIASSFFGEIRNIIPSLIKIGSSPLTMPDQLLIMMPIVALVLFYTIKYVLIMGLVIKLYVFKPKPSSGKDNKDDDEDE